MDDKVCRLQLPRTQSRAEKDEEHIMRTNVKYLPQFTTLTLGIAFSFLSSGLVLFLNTKTEDLSPTISRQTMPIQSYSHLEYYTPLVSSTQGKKENDRKKEVIADKIKCAWLPQSRFLQLIEG